MKILEMNKKLSMMKSIGIFFGSNTGNTENVATLIQIEIGKDKSKVFDVASAKKEDLEKFDILIFGTSTWGVGEIQEDFENFLDVIGSANLAGKTIALFGCGDQDRYSETFVDGMGVIFNELQEKGCSFIGETSKKGYNYIFSLAERDGKLVGLAIDEDSQGYLTAERIKNWVSSLHLSI